MCKNESCCVDLKRVLSPGLFKALCDPTRVSILARIAETCGEMSVSQVAEGYSIDISVVSRHLATLRDAGILKSMKRGKEVFYSVRVESLVKSLRQAADAIEACCLDQYGNEKEKNNEQAR